MGGGRTFSTSSSAAYATASRPFLTDGLPAGQVAVRFVPDQQDFHTTVDPFMITSPAVVTGPDGAFDLSIPPQGSGQLVIGGGPTSKVRLPYSDASSRPSVTDVGDIVLPVPTDVLIRLRGNRCALFAAGPIEQLGVEVIRAVATQDGQHHRFQFPERGLWWLVAECQGRAAGLTPRIISVGGTTEPVVIEVTVQRHASGSR